MPKRFWVIVGDLILTILIVAGVYLIFGLKPFDKDLSQKSLSKQALNNTTRADTTQNERQESPLQIINGTDVYGYPVATVKAAEMRQLLLAKDFDRLNRLLDQYQREAERDIRQEYKVYDAYEALGINDPKLQGLFDEWVKRFPNNYQSYLARAAYLQERGWQSRGFKWASETKEEQFQKMHQYFSATEKDLDRTYDLYPKAFYIYIVQISINTAQSREDRIKYFFDKALDIYPDTFLIRTRYLNSLKPRWGGSYAAMQELALKSQRFAATNPKLKLLLGFAYADQADIDVINDHYQQGVKLYNKALSFGDYWEFYQGRAYGYVNLKNYNFALADINRAVQLRPQITENLLLRAKIFSQLGRIPEAKNDLREAEAISPNDPKIAETRDQISAKIIYEGFQLYQGKKYQEAIAKHSLAIEVDPNSSEAYYWRGQGYAYNHQYELALADYKEAIRLDPKNYDAYVSLDWVLVREKRWDEIIAYWDQYLKLMPKDGRAYLERGGTKYRKGDLKAALVDAEKACKLGNKEGCKRYNELKKRGV